MEGFWRGAVGTEIETSRGWDAERVKCDGLIDLLVSGKSG